MARKRSVTRELSTGGVPAPLGEVWDPFWADLFRVKALYVAEGIPVPAYLEPYSGIRFVFDQAPAEVRFHCFREAYCEKHLLPVSVWDEVGICHYHLRRSRYQDLV